MILGLGLVGLFLFIGGFYLLFQDQLHSDTFPQQIYQRLVPEDKLELTEELKTDLDRENIWFMLLDEKGQVESSFQLPSQFNKTYSRADIASFSRWYLDDYPVFTYILDDKLLVLGYPSDSYTKLNNVLQIAAFEKLFYLILAIAILLFVIYFLFYWRSRLQLQKEIAPITQALENLSQQEIVLLDEKGNLSEIKSAINQTSRLLQETKNLQNHWIRGVTHDLRSPLTLTLGYTNQLEQLHGPSTQTQQIFSSIQRMERIIENLSLIYRLQSQAFQEELVRLDMTAFVRQIIAQFLNQHPEAQLTWNLPDHALYALAHPILLERAIQNCLINSLLHNEQVRIQVTLNQQGQKVSICLKDNGTIQASMVQALQEKRSNLGIHGMGTLITKQIMELHQGQANFCYLNPGLEVDLLLPCYSI